VNAMPRTINDHHNNLLFVEGLDKYNISTYNIFGFPYHKRVFKMLLKFILVGEDGVLYY
jgi:hypothetical protein